MKNYKLLNKEILITKMMKINMKKIKKIILVKINNNNKKNLYNNRIFNSLLN